MKFSGGKVELAAVASICVLLLSAEARFGAFSAAAALLSTDSPAGRSYVVAGGVALWLGMALYSLRRRRELSREIEAHKKLRSELEASLITDKMTGLPNRTGLAYYLSAAAAALADDQDLVLIGIAFSNLKTIANVQGFETAEAMVTEVANRLAARVRPPDLVAGVNGEHYYVLLHGERGALLERAATLTDSLIATLRSVELRGGLKLPLALHVGVADRSLCPRNATSTIAAQMLRRCDLAVHEAAQRGAGSVVVFDETMEKSIDRRGVIEASLDEAIRNGRIEPYFQPLIELSDGSIAGFEVLSRWKHPTLGAVPPAVFIPIAAESGRLEELTLSVLDRACRAATDWPGDFRLAFNVSPKSLNNERFLQDFVDIVRRTEFPSRRVEVEITEDAFVQDAANLSAPIAKLKSAGMSLAIDDFGTGYASLRHLRILPFDKIKIDQSFVADMMHDPESRKIVEAIVGLGRSMGLTTVAEGIESEEQADAMRGLGCRIGQGYVFAKALPAEQVPDFMRIHARVAAPLRLAARAA
jgi:diguanylate cyclase (GGDEF)-like protein